MLSKKRQAYLNTLKNRVKVKHIVDITDLLSTGNATVVHPLVQAVDNPVLANAGQVATGSIVHSLILNINIASTETGATVSAIRVDWYLIFNQKGLIVAPNFPAPQAVGIDQNKDLVFKQGMEMTNNTVPVLLKGAVKIPKKWQHLNRGDEIDLVYRFSSATANASSLCCKAIYREYR